MTGVEVKAAGNNGMQTTGSGFEQNQVDIGSDGKPCMANMMVMANIIYSDADHVGGTASLRISAADGADCPAFTEGPPCTVTTPLVGVRVP